MRLQHHELLHPGAGRRRRVDGRVLRSPVDSEVSCTPKCDAPPLVHGARILTREPDAKRRPGGPMGTDIHSNHGRLGLPGLNDPAESRFTGTRRFELLALLGRGASGAVYEAFDCESGSAWRSRCCRSEIASGSRRSRTSFVPCKGSCTRTWSSSKNCCSTRGIGCSPWSSSAEFRLSRTRAAPRCRTSLRPHARD